jgi:YVTN family beta-propeller protein
MSSPNTPLLLAELGIPGRSKDPVSKDPDVWGINIAAALGNFPLHGLQCQAGPWGKMASGDRLTIFWGTGLDAGGKTVLKDEVNTQLRMFVPSRHMVDGQFAVSYTVKPLGGTDESSQVMQVLVKLTRPGGHDDNGDGGHSKLIMTIPREILDRGIDKDNVADGVPITIGKNDGTPPYPFAAADDVCRVSWGGIFVFSAPLTQEQAEGKAPLIVNITEAAIREAGDVDRPGLAVAFEVYDKVFNRSEDWSPEQRVVVAVDTTRLDAPVLKEARNNELDLDALAGKPGTAQVVATAPKFKLGDIIIVQVRGTPIEGAPIDFEVPSKPLDNLPSIVELDLPNAVLMQLAKTTFSLSCRVEKADGSADLRSKSQFIRAIGEVQRLAAPIMLDEDSGALDPTLTQIRLKIPFDKSFVEGDVLQPTMLGTTPGLKPYLPVLPTRPITHNDIIAQAPLSYSIDGKHLAPVNGGTAEFYYQLLIPSAVLATLDPFEASRAIRESIHTDILQVGEPRLELPEPVVAGVVDGVLPADTAGTTLTVPYTETVKGDEVFMFWIGSITGEYPDSIKLNELTAGKEVPFTIPAAVIKGNEGGTVEAKYEIKRADGRTSYAEPLEFSVGVALENPLPLPQMPEATGTGANVTLAPLSVQNGARVIVAYTGMNDKQNIKLTMEGTPGAGSPDIPAKPGVASGSVEFLIPATAIAASIGNETKTFTIDYEVTAGQTIPSLPLTVSVMPLPATELDKISIEQAEGTVLDLSKVTAGATIVSGVWAFIAVNHKVKLMITGTKNNGEALNQVVWPWPSSRVNQNWIDTGRYAYTLAYNAINDLADGSRLELHFKAALTLSQVEAEAIDASVKVYTIRAVPQVVPTFTNAPYTVAPAGRLKNIELLLSTSSNAPVPRGKLSLTLPANFTYADGGSGQREFVTDDLGRLSVSGVKGGRISGSYSLSAASGSQTASATVTVTGLGPIGSIPVGRILNAIAVSADGTRVYVSNYGDDTVSVIDTATDRVVTNIPVGDQPKGVAISPDGTHVFVSSFRSDIVSVIETATDRVLTNIPVENNPTGITVSPDGTRVYVSNQESQRVSVIDTVTNRVLWNIPVGGAPRGVAINPDGTRVYVANSNSGTVSVIDTATDRVVTNIRVGDRPYGIACSPDGTRVYVTIYGDDTVSVIDTTTNRVVTYIPVGSYPTDVALSPDGTRAYVANHLDDTVSVIDTATDRVLTNIPVGRKPSGITFSPDGTRAYIVNGAGMLSVIEGPSKGTD